MNPCNLCPRKCNVDRSTPDGLKRALCRASDTLKVALVSLHPWEEPCISGKNGAGTIFFSHCNLRCAFCQNFRISDQGWGIEISVERLADIMLEQQSRGASCVELVTPTHYSDKIVDALKLAKTSGLAIPVAYNSNAYELPSVLERFSGLVDIFMPDLKYFDARFASRYSAAPHYFEYATQAIRSMVRLVGEPIFDDEGLMKRGVIVRHLILPWLYKDSFACLDWLYKEFGDRVYVSLMNQYMPIHKAQRHPEINRPLTTLEYDRVVKHARDLGIKNAYIQIGKTNSEKFIPIFDGQNVRKQFS